MTTYLGVAVLILLVAGQWGWSRYRTKRLLKRWSRGQAALQEGNMVAAEAAFRECVKILPTAGPAHRALGGVLARRGKLAEAEERLRFGAELEPRNPAGFIDLGYFFALCAPDRAEDAIDAFATAVTESPNVRNLLRNEARFEPLRRYEKFRKIIEETE